MNPAEVIAKELQYVLHMEEWNELPKEKQTQFLHLHRIYQKMKEEINLGGECPRCGENSLITRSAMVQCENQECDYWHPTT